MQIVPFSTTRYYGGEYRGQLWWRKTRKKRKLRGVKKRRRVEGGRFGQEMNFPGGVSSGRAWLGGKTGGKDRGNSYYYCSVFMYATTLLLLLHQILLPFLVFLDSYQHPTPPRMLKYDSQLSSHLRPVHW